MLLNERISSGRNIAEQVGRLQPVIFHALTQIYAVDTFRVEKERQQTSMLSADEITEIFN